MAIQAKFNDKVVFGVGDIVSVTQKVSEGDKQRKQVFKGAVISIRGRGENKTFTLRRVGQAQIGIERIFPLTSPNIVDLEVARVGVYGIRKSKLYYIRGKSRKEIEKIYSRAKRRNQS